MLRIVKRNNRYICIIMAVCLCLAFASCAKQENFKVSEQYTEIKQNQFVLNEHADLLSFSLKVDTAAYTNVSRYINNGLLPPVNSVRTEELINYFDYDADTEIGGEHPFGVTTYVDKSPFAENKYMAYIRVKTADIDVDDLPPSNLTFLIDVSGSMMSYDKLPLLQQAFSLLVENLSDKDTVSIVSYGDTSKVLLDSANGSDKEKILSVIHSLEASGSTAGANGIQTAYELAKKNFRADMNNRVILATDGDFNVGISDTEALKTFISEKRNEGVYLSVLGFGTGNLRDDIMETLAANGNGNYSYIDTLMTAEKVLVEEMGANMFVAAKDVKAQLEFNKKYVKEFRLVGYENRLMSSEEFGDENKDAGEIGAGTDIVVLVELVLEDGEVEITDEELLKVCIRYKSVETGEQKELKVSVINTPTDNIALENDFSFACSVAAYAELLRNSDFIGNTTAKEIADFSEKYIGDDLKGYRKSFLELVLKTLSLKS